MKLPISSLFDKKPKSEYFLSLLLRDNTAHAVIIEETSGKIKIIGKHGEKFSAEIEAVSDEELLTILDKTISKAEESLPPNIQTEKTVFGVKQDWVEEKKIKKDYLLRLKKVCESLKLSPIGFLVISEAIAHLIQEEEGAPLSAILCEIASKNVTLTLFRAGKIIETKTSFIDTAVPDVVDALLKHIESVEVLPSRIIISNGTPEDLAQQFISHQWSKSLPFLHMPQISVLPRNFEAKAVVFGAALQMGFEIIGAIVDKTGQEIKTFSTENGQTQPPLTEDAASLSAPTTAVPSITPDEALSATVPLAATSTGAEVPTPSPEQSAGQTAASSELSEKPTDTTPVPTNQVADTTPPLEELSGDNFGFVREQDIATIATSPSPSANAPASAPVVNETVQSTQPSPIPTSQTDDELFAQPVEKESLLSKFSLGRLGDMLSTVKSKLTPSSLFSLGGMGSKKLLIIPLALVILIGLLVYLYMSYLKATVTLHIKTKGLEETPSIMFSLTKPNDFTSNTIAAHEIAASLDGTSSTPATGKKQVGDKAKGTVTIYNSDSGKKTLTAGQTLSSSNNVVFTLDKDVTIASATGDIFTGTKPGTAQAAVTAKDIGPDSNLPSNTKFSVSGAGGLAGKNDSAFSGGSKKDVTVVAKADMDKLVSDIQKSLEDKASEELKKKVSGDDVLLPFTPQVSMDKKSFNKNLGEETKTVTLNATATFTSATYKKSDLNDFASVFLKNKFDQDLTISEKGTDIEVQDTKQKNDDEITANLHIKAGLLPKLDTASLQKQITGKTFTQAIAELQKTPQFDRVEFVLKPNLPLLPKRLPQKTQNITVTIATNE